MALFTSCEKEGVPHTGDKTGDLYGVWILNTKAETVVTDSEVNTTETDYTKVHFYLALSEFPFPHAIAKKGSFTDIDLDDVDVDAVTFTYNADESKISFKKKLWLSDELFTYNMILDGTFDVKELTEKTLVISQENALLKKTTSYSFVKQER